VEAGKLDAQLVLNSVPKGSDVAVIEGDPGTTSSTDRVKGFTDAAKEGGLNIVASQPANWNRKKAAELAMNMLKGDPGLQAIFVANDDMALGVVSTVTAAGGDQKSDRGECRRYSGRAGCREAGSARRDGGPVPRRHGLHGR
jgi:ribose transport system substrate-binding protein